MAVQSALPDTVPAVRPDWVRAGPALVFAGVFAALMLAAPKLLGDPDTHWHIAVGHWIWQHGRVPWTDSFSHTFAGEPWIAKEWLSQLLLHGAWRTAGWAGIVVLTAGTLSLLFALLFAWLAARCRPLFALVLTLLAAALLAPHFLARPHVIAFLPLLLWTQGLVEALDERRAPRLRLLALLVVWANLHGSFTVAYPIAALLAVEAIAFAPTGERRRMTLTWATFGALALAAGCATPYGIHAVLVTFTVLGGGEPLPFIIEWQPIGWGVAGFVSCAAALAFTAGLAMSGPRYAARIALVVLLTAMSVRYSRFVDVFALVAPLLVAAPFARRFPEFAVEPSTSAPRGRWPILVWPALAGVAAGALAGIALQTFEPDPDVTPRAALASARAAGVSGPVYNSYDYGGYLISEGVPTFVDGRTDQLFLGGFVSGLLTSVNEEDGAPFLGILSRHGVTWAIVRSDGPEARHLDAAAGWTRIHRDANATVHVRALRGRLP